MVDEPVLSDDPREGIPLISGTPAWAYPAVFGAIIAAVLIVVLLVRADVNRADPDLADTCELSGGVLVESVSGTDLALCTIPG